MPTVVDGQNVPLIRLLQWILMCFASAEFAASLLLRDQMLGVLYLEVPFLISSFQASFSDKVCLF
jgi:hypothetical protein